MDAGSVADQLLLSKEDAARLLGVSPNTLNNWRVQRRSLPYVRLGRVIRYRLADLEQFIVSNTVANKEIK